MAYLDPASRQERGWKLIGSKSIVPIFALAYTRDDLFSSSPSFLFFIFISSFTFILTFLDDEENQFSVFRPRRLKRRCAHVRIASILPTVVSVFSGFLFLLSLVRYREVNSYCVRRALCLSSFHFPWFNVARRIEILRRTFLVWCLGENWRYLPFGIFYSFFTVGGWNENWKYFPY